MATALHLYEVLRAVPTACGRINGIDWPCGVLVVPRGEGRLLRDAFVVTTRAASDFAPGSLVPHNATSLPPTADALRQAMNDAVKGRLVYRNVHTFGIAHQTHRADQSDDALTAMIGAHAWPASPALLDALGPGALSAEHRYVFFRVGKG